MNKKCIVLVSLVLLAISGCQSKRNAIPHDSDVYYTCSMDPQVHENHPGKCPICKMEMTSVHKNAFVEDAIQLSAQQIELGNIHIDTIRLGAFLNNRVFSATINADPDQMTVVSARAGGRLDKLFVQTLGATVRPGDRLFDLYSDELSSAQQEYLLLLAQRSALSGLPNYVEQTIYAARQKLQLLGMAPEQVAVLEKQNKQNPITTFSCPQNAHGIVIALPVKEGDYVMQGAPIVQLAELSTVLVEVQVFASQLEGIGAGTPAIVRFPDLPEKEVRGEIQFGNPEVSSSTRLVLLRLKIPNPGMHLKPGMPAYVSIENNRRNILTLPTDAVLRDSKSASVWVQTSANTFQLKMVKTGAESNGRLAILSGLSDGDAIVVSGAYLLESEYIFKKGADPMAGMQH